MTTSISDSFRERKERLRQSFLEQLDPRLTEARRLAGTLVPGEARPEPLRQLHLLLHTLKGSSASFGLSALSALVEKASDALAKAVADGGTVTEGLVALVTGTLERCEDPALRRVDSPADAERVGLGPQAPGNSPTGAAPAGAPWSATAEGIAEPRRDSPIYLCDDDTAMARELSTQLACFGYRVKPFDSLRALRAAIAIERPAALVMEVAFPEGEDAGPIALAAINDQAEHPLPCIFVSRIDTFSSRLKAVRAGGYAFCSKPAKTGELLDLLDALTHSSAQSPFHVIVVDDDKDIARLHAAMLEEAGMIVRVADRADLVPGLLRGFNADLVLTDMYMPDCSGTDLARVLRQIPGYLSLPIIYLSSEKDLNLQIAAMEVGADGFMTKPVAPSRLVAEVSVRAERMRTLRGLMMRDGLTGLLNHNAILDHLHRAAAKAQRDRTPLSFVMLDVDRFKQVNDRYGHPAGDQVLMALGRSLRLRLRACDPVGRYGGEEFAVVLTGSGAAQTKDVVDRLRDAFSEIVFYTEDERFSCTFSAGVADLGGFHRVEALIEAADTALYKAKRAGRNRVEIAAPVGAEVAA